MTDLDEKIRRAIQAGDNPDPDLLPDEQSVWTQWFGVYRGRNGWINLLTGVMSFVFFVVAIWMAYSFFNAETTHAMLAWGLGCLFCMIAVGNLKMWTWMQMDKNAILREVKRLELQVAILAQRLER